MIQEKIAQTGYPVMEEIAHRWSPRAFSEKPVDKQKLMSMLEAARWAPSSRNEQPWRFIIAHKKDSHYSKLFEALNEWNAKWAYTAPLLLAVLAKKNFDYKNRPNNHAWYDTGAAVANLLAQATHLGLSAHQMAGIHPNKVYTNFDIDESGYDVICIIAIGYQDESRLEELEEEYRESEYKKRERKSLEDLILS